MSNLVPDMQADRIQDIDLELLWRRGIRDWFLIWIIHYPLASICP